MDRMLSQAERQKKTKVPQTTPQETAPTFAQRATSFEGGKGLSLPGKRTTHTGTQLRTPDPHNFFAISSDKAASHPTPSFTETTESAKASTPELRPVSHYFPAWRQELGALFSEEQLDTIEKAFEVTDNQIFMQGENGELAVCYQGEWAYYEAHFLTNLKESGITFTDKQIKQLIGGRGIKGFTFGRYLTLRKVQSFSYEHERTPRQSIRGNVKKISLSELRERAEKGDKEAALLAEELKLGQQLASALQRWPTDSPEYKELKALYDQFRNTVASKSTEELYQDLLQHIRDEHQYPPSYGSYLYRAIHARLRYYQSTMTADGKYVDPYLQKIYELKLWNDRVKRGEVDWNKFPGLFKKHRLRISEMREQMRRDGTLQDAIKETSKELDKLPAEELQAIEQMADKMFTVWEDFDTVWWEQNRDNIITTPQTQLAFETIRRTVRNQEPGGANAHISDVLEQVNNMQLGEDGADYYRVIYRGDNPRIPRAEDFHNVLETKGIPQEQSARAYKLNSPHISLDGDMDMVSTLVVKEGVSNTEISSVIDALTPAGWEVRLGAHELLSQIKKGQIHIHIEKIVPTTEEYAMDVSQVLQVDLRALTNGQNPQQIAKTLRYLFTRYLKEDGYQALDNIQRAF